MSIGDLVTQTNPIKASRTGLAIPRNVIGHDRLRSDRSVSCVPASVRETTAFIAHDAAFWRLFQQVGPSLRVVAEDIASDGNSFHEAGVWSDQAEALFFTSNRRTDERGRAYTALSKMEFGRRGGESGVWRDLSRDEYPYPTPNGGTILPNGNLLVCDQGRDEGNHLSSLIVVDPTGRRRPRCVLNNYQFLPFNSLNDVVVVPSAVSSGSRPRGEHRSEEDDHDDDQAELGLDDGEVILFTDPSYGHEQGFKREPVLPNQVYGFFPQTGEVRVMADGFVKPNGIVADEERRKCYITDTGYIRGDGQCDGTRPGTIHVFDILPKVDGELPFELINRRLFASVDCGAPDGIKLDQEGNVYAGCFDGVHVWSPTGKLLGKFLLSDRKGGQAGCANLCFVPGGLVCMAESRMFLVEGLRVKGALL